MKRRTTSRREMLRALGGAAARVALPQVLRASSETPAAKPAFGASTTSGGEAVEEVPPSAGGIAWVHVNGQSPEMELPEKGGAGGAFFGYDKHGWVGIFLVETGAGRVLST